MTVRRYGVSAAMPFTCSASWSGWNRSRMWSRTVLCVDNRGNLESDLFVWRWSPVQNEGIPLYHCCFIVYISRRRLEYYESVISCHHFFTKIYVLPIKISAEPEHTRNCVSDVWHCILNYQVNVIFRFARIWFVVITFHHMYVRKKLLKIL